MGGVRCRHWWERLPFDRRHLATRAGDPGDDSPTGCGAAPVLLTRASAVTNHSLRGRLEGRVPANNKHLSVGRGGLGGRRGEEK